MRPLLLALLIAAPVPLTLAQEKTLINEDDTWNLYTRLDLKYSDLGADSGLIGGVQVGGLLNNRLGIGVAAYGLLEDLNTAPAGYKNIEAFDLIYGGAMTEYRLLTDRVFHLSIGLFAGIGRLKLDRPGSGGQDEIRFDVVEPQANVLLHITPTIDLGVGIGYRWLGLRRDLPGDDNDPFDSVVTTFFLRFTEF